MKLKFSKFYPLRSPSLEIEPLEIEKHLVKVFFFWGGGAPEETWSEAGAMGRGLCMSWVSHLDPGHCDPASLPNPGAVLARQALYPVALNFVRQPFCIAQAGIKLFVNASAVLG